MNQSKELARPSAPTRFHAVVKFIYIVHTATIVNFIANLILQQLNSYYLPIGFPIEDDMQVDTLHNVVYWYAIFMQLVQTRSINSDLCTHLISLDNLPPVRYHRFDSKQSMTVLDNHHFFILSIICVCNVCPHKFTGTNHLLKIFFIHSFMILRSKSSSI